MQCLAIVKAYPQCAAVVPDGFCSRAEVPHHTQRGESLLQQCAPLGWQQPAQRLRGNIDHIDVVTRNDKIIGEFTADQTGADDHDILFIVKECMKTPVITKVVDGNYGVRCVSRDRQPDLLGAQRQHQLRIGKGFIANLHRMRGGVNGGYTRVCSYGGIELHGHLFGCAERDCGRRFFRRQRVGQHGLGIEVPAVGGDHGERRFLVKLAQFFGGVVAGKAAAKNDDGVHGKTQVGKKYRHEVGGGGRVRILSHAHAAVLRIQMRASASP